MSPAHKRSPSLSARFCPFREQTPFCRPFFDWYNHEHRHCGIALMPPEAVHYGRAEAMHAARVRVLAAAHAATPERFVRGVPRPPALPRAAWINGPQAAESAH